MGLLCRSRAVIFVACGAALRITVNLVLDVAAATVVASTQDHGGYVDTEEIGYYVSDYQSGQHHGAQKDYTTDYASLGRYGPTANYYGGSSSHSAAQHPSCPLEKVKVSSVFGLKDCCIAHELLDAPVTNAYLFVGKDFECPKLKRAGVCAAIAANPELVDNGTSLTLVESYTVKAPDSHFKTYGNVHNEDAYFHGSGGSSSHHSGYSSTGYGGEHSDVPTYVDGDASDGNTPTVIAGRWTADTAASVVAIGTGCCFNVYGAVHQGDVLNAACHNQFIGDPEDVPVILFNGVSFMVAGDLSTYRITDIGTATSANGVVIVGGGWTTPDGASSNNVNVNSQAASTGPFAGVAFAVIEGPAAGPFTVVGGDALINPDAINDVFAPFGVTIALSGQQILAYQTTIQALVCSFAHQLAALDANGEVVFDSAQSELQIDCGDFQQCVVDVEAEVLDMALDITSTSSLPNNDPQIFLRISSGSRVTITDAPTFNGGAITAAILLPVFLDAHQISFISQDVDIARAIPVIAPFAASVNIRTLPTNTGGERSQTGPLVMGRRSSMMVVGSGNVGFTSDILPFSTPPEAEVVLCDCVCPVESLESEVKYFWRCKAE